MAKMTKNGVKTHRGPGPAVLLAAAGAFLAGPAGAQTGPTAADSGWVRIFNGQDFGDAFYAYSNGYIDIKDQTRFTIQDSMIRATGSYTLLVTVKEYSHYKLRLDYRFAPSVGANANAGLMVLMDNAAAKVVRVGTRPRSIEVNCRRDGGYPWSLWAAGSGYGPYMATTVRSGTNLYLPKSEGGVEHVVAPTGEPARVLGSTYPNPEKPPGEWNHGEAWVYGDSGVFLLNGKIRTSAWNFTVRNGTQTVKVASGGVGVQAEGSEVWYRNWEIQELDPATRVPIHATRGCTNPSSPRFNPRAVVNDGSCAGTGVRTARGRGLGGSGSRKTPRLRTLDGRLEPRSGGEPARPPAAGIYVPAERP